MTRTLQRKPPEWIRVAGTKEGGDLVEFLMTPASTIQHELAVDLASAAARELQRSAEVRQAYGLEALPVAEVAEEGEAILGLSSTLLAVELALIVATDFRGYLGEDGETPAEFNRRNVALAMQDWDGGRKVANRFLDLALAPVYRSKDEGKP